MSTMTTTTTTNEAQATVIQKIPIPVQGKHPLRFGIHGDEEKIDELKKIIQGYDGLHAGLKAYLLDELDKAPGTHNAASIDLHDVERPGHGFDLQVSVRWRQHGRRMMSQGLPVAPGNEPKAPPVPQIPVRPPIGQAT